MISHIQDGYLRVCIKPNSDRNQIEGWDDAREELLVRIAVPADKGKANKELVKFMSKELGKSVRIKSGMTSRTKLLQIG